LCAIAAAISVHTFWSSARTAGKQIPCGVSHNHAMIPQPVRPGTAPSLRRSNGEISKLTMVMEAMVLGTNPYRRGSTGETTPLEMPSRASTAKLAS
jgi:hypothetical protein